MIPALILYLIRRFKRKSSSAKITNKLISKIKKIRALLFFALMICLSAFTSFNNSESITYNVINGDKTIGTIKTIKNGFKDSETYTLESNIKAKFLFKFNIIGKEKSVYKKGILVFSSVFRTVNNKTKTNHKIVLDGNHYNLESNKNSQALNVSLIKQNLITLYYEEPIGISSVFCDNIKQMAPVKPMGKGQYKVEFTNGKYNVFHYKNGKCIKIEAKSTLFNVDLIPVNHE
ncbi:DUF6134 family protein [Hwangdonia seohaensis]|uniref:DUF6134 family protein n=1 Tax=Hwangdonia seohaensis TaxID=1240727 RepID=A0ABW3RF13_9FLAO|nr:DUF6134 family protein [Hwangdonia seohaensis]